MAYYKVSVDVSDLFDDMLVQAQKSFLIDKFCSLATDQQIEVVSEMLENLVMSICLFNAFGHKRY